MEQPLLSIILPIDATIAPTLRALLATTSGPYELVTVSGSDAEGLDVANEILSEHTQAREHDVYRTHYQAASRMGLQRVSNVQARPDRAFSDALNMAVLRARGRYIVRHRPSARPLDFAWDRYLRRPFMDHADIFAISATCAHDLVGNVTTNTVGNCEIGQTESYLGDRFWARDAADEEGPVMVDAVKLLALGNPMSLTDGCLAARKFSWRCGYFPVALDFDAAAAQSKTSHDDTEPSQREQLSPVTDTPITIVTGASQNHFASLRQLHKSVKKYMPDARFVVYDLGFDEASVTELRTPKLWPGIEYRRFEFERFPSFFDITVARGAYAWKALIIVEMLREVGGMVIWLDGGDKIARRPVDMIRSAAHSGIFSPYSVGTLERWTHVGTLDALEVPEDVRKSGLNCNGAIMFVSQEPRAVLDIVEPYELCAMKESCIAPPGSNLHNHRQDQAVFSALMAKHGRVCPREQYDLYPHSERVTVESGWPIYIQQDAPGDGSDVKDYDL